MRSFHLFIALALCFGSLSLPSFSQEDEEQVDTRIHWFSLSGKLDSLGLWTDKGFQKLWIPSGYLPDAERYTGPNPLTVVQMEKRGEEEGEVPVPAAIVRIPPDAKQVLVMVRKTDNPEEGEPPYQSFAVDVSMERLPEESYWVWNLTGRPVRGKVGSLPLRVDAGQRTVLRPGLEGGPRAVDAKLLFGDDPSGGSYTSTKWFLNPDQRLLMMLLRDGPEGEDKIRVKALKL